jgi:phytoene dehydrogenase-like protein
MVATLRPTNNSATVSGRFDVAVVGGGLAGLTAAATAAQAGRSVVLFEQASVPGGRARTRTEDGFSFNIGPHALFRKSLALDVLRGVGVEVNAGAVELNGSRMVNEGHLYPLPIGLGSLVASPLLDWRGKLEVGMFLGSLGRMDPRPLEGLTVSEWLGRAIHSPSARRLVEVSIRTATYANDLDRVSAEAGLRQLQRGFSGALYVHGGWQTIVDDLRARAEALGVAVVDGARVARVELAKNELAEYGTASSAVQAVRLADGRRYEVGAAILAVPPRQASALVDGGRQAALAGWADRAVPVRAAVLDVGLRRLPNPETWYAMGYDRPLYLSVHSKWARLAPEGGALVHVLRYLGSTERGGEEDERELERMLDLMQPGWRDEVVTRRFMPDLTVVGALSSVNWEQRDGPRGPAVPQTDGLFVAGDWVTPEGMLADRALVSGARAGELAAALRPTLTVTEAAASRGVTSRGAA